MQISFEGNIYEVEEGITVKEVLNRFNSEHQEPPRVLIRKKLWEKSLVQILWIRP